MEAGGGRIHAIWLPSENLKLDFTIGYDYNDKGDTLITIQEL